MFDSDWGSFIVRQRLRRVGYDSKPALVHYVQIWACVWVSVWPVIDERSGGNRITDMHLAGMPLAGALRSNLFVSG